MNSASVLYQPVFTQYGNNNFLILFYQIHMYTHTDVQKINGEGNRKCQEKYA